MMMDTLTCILINGPPFFLNLAINSFYIFCIFCPLHAERIKQPLKLLLCSLISCTIAFSVSIVVGIFSEHQLLNSMKIQALLWVSNCALALNMTSSVWLSLFFYTQIVPASQALFVWIKRNIKPIIYCIFLLEKMFCLFQLIFMFLNEFFFRDFEFSSNFTMDHANVTHAGHLRTWLSETEIYVLDVYFFICLCVMVMSNGATVVYLSRHMGRMAAHGHPLSCPQFRGQVRVAVIGTLEAVLYVACAAFDYSFYHLPSLGDPNIHFTVVNFYMLSITLSLGAGFTLFRQRAADIWTRVTQWCKTPQQQQQGG